MFTPLIRGFPGGQREVSRLHRIVENDAARCLSHLLLCSLSFSLFPSSYGTRALRENTVAFEVLYLLRHVCTYDKILESELCLGAWVSRAALSMLPYQEIVVRGCHSHSLADEVPHRHLAQTMDFRHGI